MQITKGNKMDTPNHDRADIYYDLAKTTEGDPIRYLAWECALKANALDTAEDRIKELQEERDKYASLYPLCGLLKEVDDALYWLLNLVHGNSKGGPDYNPPSEAEWTEAIAAGEAAHDKVNHDQ